VDGEAIASAVAAGVVAAWWRCCGGIGTGAVHPIALGDDAGR